MQLVCSVLLCSVHTNQTRPVSKVLRVNFARALGGTLDVSRQELSYSSQKTIWDGFPLDDVAEAMYVGEGSKEMMDSTILYRML